MKQLSTLLLMLVLGATKYSIAPASALAAGYSPIKATIVVIIGAWIGAISFFLLGKRLMKGLSKIGSAPKKPKKRFTKKNRFIVYFKNRFGIIGLAALCPLISIPVSAIICSKYHSKNKMVIPIYMVVLAIETPLLTYFSEPVIQFFKNVFS